MIAVFCWSIANIAAVITTVWGDPRRPGCCRSCRTPAVTSAAETTSTWPWFPTIVELVPFCSQSASAPLPLPLPAASGVGDESPPHAESTRKPNAATLMPRAERRNCFLRAVP